MFAMHERCERQGLDVGDQIAHLENIVEELEDRFRTLEFRNGGVEKQWGSSVAEEQWRVPYSHGAKGEWWHEPRF